MSIWYGEKTHINVETGLEELRREHEAADRRLYLYGTILSEGNEDKTTYEDVSMTTRLAEQIINFNREDAENEVDPADRKPIRLYINSPGGEVTEGFALVSAIELSQTPVWTINVGEWCSMAFLIGITGHRRLSMPNMMFLMHEGTSFAGGSAGKMQDRAKFNERFKEEVIKRHVLSHSDMDSHTYDVTERVELYMLPEDALKYGFIDEIVTDISAIF